MARRGKKRSTKRTTRRRSMGATASNFIMSAGGIIAGAVIAKQLNKMLKFDAKILAAGKIVAGVMLPKFIKTPIVASIGQGMIAVGGTELVGSFIPSLGAADDVVLLSGYDMGAIDTIGADISEVNGTDISEVNGYDEY
jgi:predicted glycosyltransferase